MLTLSLLRHAKSSWSDPDLEDHDRPLSKRGVKAAPQIAKYMHQAKLSPGLVLCSTAVRTRATLALLLATRGGAPPEIAFVEALYLASPQGILGLVQGVPARQSHVLVVGHNPGMHALALELINGGERKAIGAIAMGFPTAALAVFRFNVAKWAEVRCAAGYLEDFVRPRDRQG